MVQRQIEAFGESATAAFVVLVDVALSGPALLVLDDRGGGDRDSSLPLKMIASVKKAVRMTGRLLRISAVRAQLM